MVLLDNELNEWVRQFGYVELRWTREEDDVNRISIAAMSAAGYGGVGKGWVNEAPVRLFAERLGDYPLNDAELPALVTGMGVPLVVQLGLRVYPIGSWGQLGIHVRLATEPWQSPTMRPEEHEAVALEVRTTYERAASFGRDLRAVLDGRDNVARIEGEHLA